MLDRPSTRLSTRWLRKKEPAMPLIECIELSKDWSGTPLFDKASFSIDPGQKIGLVGRNGTGKTSLVRILAGLDDDYRGSMKRKKGLIVALVPQLYEPPAGPTCVELLLEPLRLVEAEIARMEELFASDGPEASGAAALEAYGSLMERYQALGGPEAETGARRLLARAGLGATADAPASALSGGEKNVLSLARALAEAPELLILDEPGNHLDFAGLAWLEDFIRGERRAVLMVSHNRRVLDATVGSILELEGGKVTPYAGGWSDYRLEKLKRAAGQGKEWQADRRRIERLEALVRRFADIARARPDPSWGKRLRARRSQLERERAAAAEKPDFGADRMRVSFGAVEAKSDYALIVQGYSRSFGERVLFADSSLDLLAGERAALVGPNGSGKTTFIRDLVAAQGRWDEGGPIRVGPSMRIGYCAQEQEVFSGTRTVGEELEALGATRDEAFKLLKRYLFDRSALDAPTASLSGGERNRLQIARAVLLGANFLVLDEPTNHLDIESREALEEGLADFPGTMLVVSHDRWFLEKVAERLILIEDRGFRPYEGSFAEYWRDVVVAGGAGVSIKARGEAKGQEGQRRGRIEDRAASRKLPAAGPGIASRRKALEERITSLEKRREELEAAAARSGSGRDYERAGRSAEAAAAASRELERLYAEWEALD